MKSVSAILLALCLSFSNNANATSFTDFFGPRFNGVQTTRTALAPKNALDCIHRWNAIAINASGLDHTPLAPGEIRTFGEQLGPGRASRAMAIVHIAIFDSVNSVLGGYQSFTGIQSVKPPVSLDAAVAQAAHDTLAALYPSQAPAFDSLLADDLAKISNKNARANGVSLGQRAAAAILALRTNDGSQVPEPHFGVDYFPNQMPGYWRQDPVSLIPIPLGAHWGECKTFVVQSASQFRVPPPPDMTSVEYTTAYNEAKSVGGDGMHTTTMRTPEQTFIGIFWAYDGTPSLCAPPRFYNQIIVHIADQMHLGTVDLARLLALANTAMADAGMSIWESKYYYDFWRPVGAIRDSDFGTGSTLLGDGNALNTGDLTFTTMGAPASNFQGTHFTPPYYSY